jgi:2-C-methyl-D-erythritol 4-phosphate cytidylyltransferase
VAQLLIGVAQNDTHWPKLGFEHKKLAAAVDAGPERVDTVESCLNYIVQQGGADDWALVHDAARPCVRVADISALLEAVVGHTEGGILAVPLSDTIKRSGPESLGNMIQQTVPRNDLWRAMTPQLFKVGALLAAIRKARADGVSITDEASAMEAAGAQTLLVPCSPDNIKITLPQDIQFAQMILQTQAREAK